jgi:predicted transposase YdaD
LARPFDVTLKSLLEDAPQDWPLLAGVPAPQVTVIDADIATLSGAADKVLRLEGPSPWIMHIEFQSGPDASLPGRANLYSAALEKRHDLPVQSVVVLLGPRANLGTITGTHERKLPQAVEPYRIFRYQVIRVWELPVETLLRGGLGQRALAPISAVQQSDLPHVIHELKRRVTQLRNPDLVSRWWTAVSVLMGLRYDKDLVNRLLKGVVGMKESVIYQAIVEEGRAEGRVEEARNLLLRIGAEHFGAPPSAALRKRIQAIQNIGQLEEMAVHVVRLRSWEEVFSGPSKSTRRKRPRA